MAINIPTINEKFLDNNGQVNSTWYNYLRTGGASNIGDVLPNFFIVSGAYIQASNYWLNLSIDNGWLSGDTYQGAYADLLKLSDASSVNIRFTTSDARASEIATYGESGAFVLDTNNKRFKIPMVTKTIGNLSTLADIGTVFGNSAASGSAVYAGVKFPYFMKVGNKTLEASTVDLKKEAADQKAAIASLGQAQLEAINAAGISQITLIESAGNTQINAITSAGTIQYDAITLNGTTWKNDIIATGTMWNNAVISIGNAQVILVEDAGTTQVGLVNTAGYTQVGLVNDAGDTQVGLVNSAGATQVGLVEDEGDTQVARVISEGTSSVTAAQNWAIKVDGPVNGSDYSSKYNANLAYTYAQSVNPDNIVHIAGTETITGIKTFTSSPIVPTPTTDYQAATKKYVDDNAGTSALPLLTPLYLDYVPDDSSYVLSDGSSYVSGSVYTTAYQHLLYDYTNGTSDSETVGGVSVTFVRAPDGHKIIDVSNLANYQGVLSATGTAWYYVLDQANTRFMLPFTNWFIQGGATTAGSLAAYQAAGLPNITGTLFSWLDVGIFSRSQVGVFENNTSGNTSRWPTSDTSGNNSSTRRVSFNASISNAIYGSSTTVQPKSNKLALYFVCGNSVTNTYLIDASGLASKDLNDLTDAGKVMAGMGFGTCSTASATAAKEVAITGFTLTTGVRVKVKFDNANTVAGALTLNVNSTGAIAICNEAGVAVSATSPAYFPAGATVEFWYDGTNWIYINRVVDSYVNGISGYEILTNGKIKQWGLEYAIANNSTLTITLLKPMKDIYYNVTISQCASFDAVSFYTNQGAVLTRGMTKIQLTNRRFNGSGTYTIDIMWKVEGY